MEHSCHKCGQSVEDGVPFCAHCGAPQIRVSLPEPAVQLVSAEGPAAPGAAAAILHGSHTSDQPGNGIQWSIAIPACAWAGLIAALLMCLGLMVPFLAMLGCGFLAVIFYRRRNPGTIVKVTAGAQLGAVSGILSFGISAIYAALAVALFHAGGKVQGKMLEAIQQAATRTTDPQAQAMLEYFKSPAGLAVMMLFVAIFALLAFIVLASIGGAVGGASVGRRDRS